MDDELQDVFIAKYYIGFYSVKKEMAPDQLIFTCNVMRNYRKGLESYQNTEINNMFHLAFIIGIVDASPPGETRDTFYRLMEYYLTKVDRNILPVAGVQWLTHLGVVLLPDENRIFE